MNQRILERVGREAKTAKTLRFCRERDKTQETTNRILYEHTENRYLDRLDKEWREKASSVAARKLEAQRKSWKKKHKHSKTGLLSKLQCLQASKLFEVWDKEWRRRGEMKLEEDARKDQERTNMYMEKNC